MTCGRVRGLFGAYWDDEITQAEREWMDAHFASCPSCRAEYEAFSRSLEWVASLPREEAAPGFADRVLARARRATQMPDRLPVARVRWVPLSASVALATLLLAAVVPWLRPGFESARVATHPRAAATGSLARGGAPAGEAGPPVPTRRESMPAQPQPGALASALDSLFDHTEDVEFILDPVTVHRDRAHPAASPATSVQGERAVITF